MTVQIDWRNPLTRGLFRANIPSGPYSVNLVSSRISALAAGTYSTGVSRVGRVQYGSESGGNLTGMTVYATDNIFKTYVDDTFTVAGLIYLPDNYASPAMVMGEGDTNQGSCAIIRTGNFTHVWNARVITGVTGPVVTTTDDAVDAVAGGSYLVFLSFNRNATDKLVLDVYRLDTGAQERVTSTDDVTNDFTGYDSFAFGWGDDVGAALHLTWNRELTKAERNSLAVNPWQLFKAQPIIGAHQLPTHVDYGMVKMPWTQCPPGHVRSDKVDFFLNPRSYGTTGRAWNQGRDETADQSDTAVSGYSVVSTQFGGPALALTGVSAQRTEFPANVFVPQDDPKWNDLLTVGAWVRCTDVSDDQQIVGQWKALTQDRSWRLELDTTGSALNFRVQTVDDTGDVVTLDIIDTQDLSDGEWHFVAAVFDNTSGTTQCEAFVDGVSVAAASGGAAAGWNNPTAPGPVTIGVRDDADDEPFNGDIFGLFIVREKWTPTEISSIYHNPWQIFQPKEIIVPINEDLPELGRFEIQS